mmetsp:Transcript_8262/g.15379  ORF Transcript_8262/g.15379 Transcript_8262/m.15379 type:complete len:229 (-) Transcript_8262:540-1226(-)
MLSETPFPFYPLQIPPMQHSFQQGHSPSMLGPYWAIQIEKKLVFEQKTLRGVGLTTLIPVSTTVLFSKASSPVFTLFIKLKNSLSLNFGFSAITRTRSSVARRVASISLPYSYTNLHMYRNQSAQNKIQYVPLSSVLPKLPVPISPHRVLPLVPPFPVPIVALALVAEQSVSTHGPYEMEVVLQPFDQPTVAPLVEALAVFEGSPEKPLPFEYSVVASPHQASSFQSH